MSYVAVAVVGAGVVTGYMGAEAAKSGSAKQAAATEQASAMSMQQYMQQREDSKAWRAAGEDALNGMKGAEFQKDFSTADFQQDPGYQFRLAEGNKAINAAASAQGMMGSGATMKSLTKYGQNVASDEYSKAYDRYNNNLNTRFNRYASLAGVGQTANSQLANSGSNMAAQVGQNGMASANAQAAGQMGQANAYSNAIGNSTNAYMQYQMMNKMFPAKTGV